MNVAVIFAGGVGSRMRATALPKQFLEVHGKPVIVHTLENFEIHPAIDAIAVAILPEWRGHLDTLVKRYDLTKVKWVVDGGKTGQASRHRALEAVAADCPADSIVLIHDGVRPLVGADLITANIECVRQHGSAITCTKITETVVESSSSEIHSIIPRDHLYAAQAPQSFWLSEILGLYRRVETEGEHDSIDSCTLMQRYGHPIHQVEGPQTNIKITSTEDFYICRTFFELIENKQVMGI